MEKNQLIKYFLWLILIFIPSLVWMMVLNIARFNMIFISNVNNHSYVGDMLFSVAIFLVYFIFTYLIVRKSDINYSLGKWKFFISLCSILIIFTVVFYLSGEGWGLVLFVLPVYAVLWIVYLISHIISASRKN